jgi:hypothetical protein
MLQYARGAASEIEHRRKIADRLVQMGQGVIHRRYAGHAGHSVIFFGLCGASDAGPQGKIGNE